MISTTLASKATRQLKSRPHYASYPCTWPYRVNCTSMAANLQMKKESDLLTEQPCYPCQVVTSGKLKALAAQGGQNEFRCSYGTK